MDTLTTRNNRRAEIQAELDDLAVTDSSTNASRTRLTEELHRLYEEDNRPVPNENMSEDEPRYAIDVDLTGCTNNLGSIMARITDALKAHRVASEELNKFRLDLMALSYYEALALAMQWVYIEMHDGNDDDD